jgi:hypothetical protein
VRTTREDEGVTEREDTQLVDLLYGELSKEEASEYRRTLESDAAKKQELESFENVLSVLRSTEDEAPSPHLDALILAQARQQADAIAAEGRERGLRGFIRKMLRSPIAGVAVVTSLVVAIAVPALVLMQTPKRSAARYEEAPAVASPPPAPPREGELAQPEAQAYGPAAGMDEKTVALDETREAKPSPAPPTGGASARELDRAKGNASLHASPKRAPGPGFGRVRGEVNKPASEPEPPAARAPVRDADDADLFAARRADEERRAPAKKAKLAEAPSAESKPADKAGAAAPSESLAKDQRIGADVPADREAKTDRAPATPAQPRPPSGAKERADDALAEAATGKAEASKKAEPAPPAQSSAGRAAPRAVESASAPSNERALADDRAGTMAQDMIRAARSQVQARDVEGARHVLEEALAAVRGTPAAGDVELELATLELRQKRHLQAIAHARAAYATRGFEQKLAAVDVVLAAAKAAGRRADLDWARRERRKFAK